MEEEKAVTSAEDETTTTPASNEEAQTTEVTEETSETEAAAAQETEGQEVEIVLRDDDGSQPKKKTPFGFKKRINKLNEKVSSAEGHASQATQELEIERERNRLLQLALDQQKAKPELPKPPDPDDFDDGAKDPKYVQSLVAFNQQIVAEELKKQKQQAPPQQQPSVDPGLLRKQESHYQRAAELGAKNFEEVEDKAIGVLGNEIANHIIQNSDKSTEVLYYLGQNPDKAEEIAELVKSNPIKGVLEIGRLEARLKTQPKAKTNPPPEPDEELEGKASGSNALQRRLDAARKKLGDGSRMDDILAIKKEAKAKGVTVT